MTARVIPTALDPLNASALNKLSEPAKPLSKKRKLGHDTAARQLSTNSIVIRAHAASLSEEPLILNPITALPRSRLPLSWLEDASWAHSDAQPGGLFVADIPALEQDLCARTEPTVLAVRLMADNSLYVVERVKRGIYSLTRLARWVHEGDIVVAVKGWQGSSRMDIEVDEKSFPAPDALNWWQAAQIEEPSSDLGLGDEFAGLQVAVVFQDQETGPDVGSVAPSFVDVLEYRGQSLAPVSREGNIDVEVSGLSESQGVGTPDGMDVDVGVDADCVDTKQSPEELLNGMRDHYLQALYISKTSLAYFAKGPLTRCRTAFQSPGCEKSESPPSLIESYREAILAAKKMDLKYREALPALVRDALLALSDGEDGTTKKRKSKKKKLGKNGLYAEEDGFVRKWWKDRAMVEASTQENSREAETKKHISDLRLRETQLQILLILEVIALETTGAEESKDTANGKQTGEDKEMTKKPRAKKPQDLNVLLELHLDRLCIWHAVSLEETSAADTAKTSSFSEGHMSGKKVESDAVRDFCTEVIIPFYAARLPDKCKLITRKFGVSGGISPAAKKSNKRDRPEPGSEMKRQPPLQKPRRSLQRVLTDEKVAASQNRHPSLNRSNTAPSKHEITRESMEPILPTVVSGNVRGGIQVKRVENREVDLNAVARQHETKLRKVQMLVDQKKELDAAIHALRKPNRELVAKDIAEDATKRVSTSGGSSRKPKNPVRNPHGQGVQVMATPRGNRKRDTVVGLPPLPRSLKPSKSFAGEMDDHSLGESPVMIPSSGRRAISFSGPDSDPFKSGRGTGQTERRRRQAPSTELGSIQETPSRAPNRLLFDTSKGDSTEPRRMSLSSSKGGLFRVPQLPESRSTAINSNPISQPMAPSTPVSSRHKNIITSTPESKPSEKAYSSMIMETPPKPRGLEAMSATNIVPVSPAMPAISTSQPRAESPPAVISTPVKATAPIPVTPDKSQSKSIYEQLGWDDDDEMDML